MTVTVVHVKTKNPEEITRNADVVIAAVGVPNLVRGHWLKPGAVVVDVGINPVEVLPAYTTLLVPWSLGKFIKYSFGPDLSIFEVALICASSASCRTIRANGVTDWLAMSATKKQSMWHQQSLLYLAASDP